MVLKGQQMAAVPKTTTEKKLIAYVINFPPGICFGTAATCCLFTTINTSPESVGAVFAYTCAKWKVLFNQPGPSRLQVHEPVAVSS